MQYTRIAPVALFALLLLCGTEALRGGDADSLAVQQEDTARASNTGRLTLLYDPDLSMRSGVANVTTLHHWIARLEDKSVGTRWCSEESIPGKTLGIVARLTKLTLLDLPVDYFTVVLSHEYLGHGARCRELGISPVHYAFDWPPPYGPGGGEATSSSSVSIHQAIAVWTGGIEVHPLINRTLALRWMERDRANYREALLYFWSNQIMLNYYLGASDFDPILADNDPRAYVRYLNLDNGYADVRNLNMSVRDFQDRYRYNMVNPFLFYSIYVAVKSYLWDGDEECGLPALSIAGVDYLPSARVGLTPFGPEYHLENYLRVKTTVSLVDLHVGDQTFHKSWGGVGIDVQNVYEDESFSLDVNLHLWKQPALKLRAGTQLESGGGVGGAFSVRSYYHLGRSPNSPSAVVELGYKSIGFLESYPMDSSFLILVGLALRD